MALRTFSNKTLQDNWYEDRVQGHEDVPFSERTKVLCEKSSDIAFLFQKDEKTNRVSQPPVPIPRTMRVAHPSSARTLPCYNAFVDRDYKTTCETSFAWNKMKSVPPKVNRMITKDTVMLSSDPSTAPEILPKHPASLSERSLDTISRTAYTSPSERQRDSVEIAREEAAERQGGGRLVGGRPASKFAAELGNTFFKRNALDRDVYNNAIPS